MADQPGAVEPAEYFFLIGYFAAYSDAIVRFGVHPWPITEATIDKAWRDARWGAADAAEFDRMRAQANGTRSGQLVGDSNAGDAVREALEKAVLIAELEAERCIAISNAQARSSDIDWDAKARTAHEIAAKIAALNSGGVHAEPFELSHGARLARAAYFARKLSPSERKLVLSGGVGPLSETSTVASGSPLFRPIYGSKERDRSFVLTSLGASVLRILQYEAARTQAAEEPSSGQHRS